MREVVARDDENKKGCVDYTHANHTLRTGTTRARVVPIYTRRES